MNISDYKRVAREKLDGNWGREFGVIAIYFIIYLALSFFFTGVSGGNEDGQVSYNFTSILLMPLTFGLTRRYLDISRGKNVEMSGLFYYFTTGEVFGLIGMSLLVGLFTFFWTLLFIIPGIIASFAYAMASYIKIDNPEISALDAIGMSKEAMKGRKMDFFILSLSFIGWAILATITVVGLIPYTAYVTLTMVEFYRDVVGDDVELEDGLITE